MRTEATGEKKTLGLDASRRVRRHPHFPASGSELPLLFDLVADVSSEHDVAAEHPQVVHRLMRAADRARVELGDRRREGRGVRPRGHVPNPTPRTR